MVDSIVVVVVNYVGIDRCTEKTWFQRFQRLYFVQTVNTTVPTELRFKDSSLPSLPYIVED